MAVDYNYEEVTQERLKIIKGYYKDKKLNLVLGAGVSKSANLPQWWELLKSLFISAFINESDNADHASYREQYKGYWNLDVFAGKSPLEVAQYIAVGINNGSVLRERTLARLVQETMRDGMEAQEVMQKYGPWENTLSAVISLCTPEENDISPIRHILTFNYDNLFEYLYNQRREKTKKTIRSFCPENMWSPGMRLPDEIICVHHVHGIMDMFEAPGCMNRIILSEDSYDTLDDDWYDWPNFIQASLIRDTPCLFIGFSADDINFRRVMMRLRKSRSKEACRMDNEQEKHFFFMDPTPLLQNAMTLMPTKIPDLDRYIQRLRENGLGEEAALLAEYLPLIHKSGDTFWEVWRENHNGQNATLLSLCTLLCCVKKSDKDRYAKISQISAEMENESSGDCMAISKEFCDFIMKRIDAYFADQYGLYILWAKDPKNTIPKFLKEVGES